MDFFTPKRDDQCLDEMCFKTLDKLTALSNSPKVQDDIQNGFDTNPSDFV